MTDTDDRLARVLDAITQPGPVDDDPDIDHEPDGYSQAEIDRRGDEAADRYERNLERNHP